MNKKKLTIVGFICILYMAMAGTCLAFEGWVYSNEGVAYYATSESERNTFTWSGEISDGKVHGYGIQQFWAINGSKLGYYEGEMVRGFRQGYGIVSWGGYRFEGMWDSSRYQGKGKLIKGSSYYEGDFKYGRYDGIGVLITDGYLQTGTFSNGGYQGLALMPGYFVIGLCSQDRQEAEAEASRHRALGHAAIVTYSSRWTNLAAGLYIVVYGVLNTEEQVRLLDNFKFAHLIKFYIKHSGYQQ